MHPLRAYDAIQFAAALHVQNLIHQLGLDPLIFLAADKRLLAIAVQEGLSVDDPNQHP